MPRHVTSPGGSIVAVTTPVRLGLGVDSLVTLNLALPFAHVRTKLARIDAFLVFAVSHGVGGFEVVGATEMDVEIPFPLVRLRA